MAKKKTLGEEAAGLLSRGTAAQAVAVATRRSPELVVAGQEEAKVKYISVNFRVPKEMVFAIQEEAMRRFKERGGGGKPDQSDVARDIIGEWMAKRGA